jgi:hypothetical protein
MLIINLLLPQLNGIVVYIYGFPFMFHMKDSSKVAHKNIWRIHKSEELTTVMDTPPKHYDISFQITQTFNILRPILVQKYYVVIN